MIHKYQYGAPVYVPDQKTLKATRRLIGRGTRKVAEYGLKGLGWIGEALNNVVTAGASSDFGQTSPFTFSTGQERRNIQKGREQVRQQAKQKIDQGMTWVSPLNYGAALWNGHGLNAEKGAEEISTWDPRWQLLGRVGEMFTIAKGKPTVKAAVRTGDRVLAKAGNRGAKGRVVARELAKADKLEGAETVAKAYANDQEIVGPMMKSDGTNSFVWRKNRWVKEGDGLLNTRFKADEPNNPHYITQTAPDLPEIPNHTYFMGQTRLPFKGTMGNGLGGNTSTVFTPNLQYNAFRQLHWMEPKVQELGQQYLNTGNLRPILDYYRSASPIEKQQLSTIARQPLYLNSDIPYRYYTDNAAVLRENPFLQKVISKMSPSERNLFNNSLGWATTNDVGKPVIFNKKVGFLGDKVVGHEGNHAYQARFPQSEKLQKLLERALPANKTKNVKGKEVLLTGNDKRGMGSAHLSVERGSTIQDARAFITRNYYQQYGRYPSFSELNGAIDKLSDMDLTNTIKSTSAYGKEYAPLINDFSALREALKYGYKAGGKINI